MIDETGPPKLPSNYSGAILAIANSLVPGAVKSLGRLIGAALDIPTAKLTQIKGKIDAQTDSFRLVEASVAIQSAGMAAADPEIVKRSMDVLLRKEYRKQVNREAVANAMIEELREQPQEMLSEKSAEALAEPDDDWLNQFERYAEDVSSERLQMLWGRVLAGEIRRPGRFSARTLRFLSEFSQADALTFEIFVKSAFGDAAPKQLVSPADQKDIDLPLVFHPATTGARWSFTPIGVG